MGYRRGLRPPARAAWVLGLILPGLGGCAIWNSFLDPSRVGQFPLNYKEQGVRRILTPRDTPPGLPNATEPTPEDLVPSYTDYRIGPGDVLLLSINDLYVAGAREQAQLEVSSSGNIRVQQLGVLKVSGLTEQELEDELKARFREAGLLPNPDIQVYTQARRQAVFTVRGAVGRAGVYPIGEPDTRLLDVIGMIQDIGANVPRLYVIRRMSAAKAGAAEEAPGELPPEKPIIPPPEEAQFGTSLSSARGLGRGEPPKEPEVKKSDLEEVLEPGETTQPSRPSAGERRESPFAPLIFNPQTGELIERQPGAERPEPGRPEANRPAEGLTGPVAKEPFDWENVPEVELEQRVIEVDVRALLAGDPRYNLVIREKDVINVPVDTAVFYMMGEVNRPGVYGFNGRDVTIKQAVAMTGGLSPFAFPMRCEIIRHEPGTDKQVTIPVNLDAVFAGIEEDLFLRDDDIVNVGTHIISPFLYVIRNSYRFAYGFGFVYDRNFADVDTYGNKANPQIIEQQRRQSRGLPF